MFWMIPPSHVVVDTGISKGSMKQFSTTGISRQLGYV